MGKIQVKQGDITELDVDAIVNAANSHLAGGGGVDGAIHRKGGPAIARECKEIISQIGKLETGNAVITSGGNLPADFVIHTVGPVWNPDKETEMKELLAQAYKNSLRKAIEYDLKEIAFPNISTGVYGFPKELAAEVALEAVQSLLAEKRYAIKVIFICFDKENFKLYQAALQTS